MPMWHNRGGGLSYSHTGEDTGIATGTEGNLQSPQVVANFVVVSQAASRVAAGQK